MVNSDTIGYNYIFCVEFYYITHLQPRAGSKKMTSWSFLWI